MADAVLVDDRDLRRMVGQTRTLQRGMRTTVNGQMRDASERVAKAIMERAKPHVAASRTRQDDMFTAGARVKRDRFVQAVVKIAGYHTGQDGREVARPILFWGSEFGGYDPKPLRFTRGRKPTGYAWYQARDDVWRGQAGEEYRRAVFGLLKESGLV